MAPRRRRPERRNVREAEMAEQAARVLVSLGRGNAAVSTRTRQSLRVPVLPGEPGPPGSSSNGGGTSTEDEAFRTPSNRSRGTPLTKDDKKYLERFGRSFYVVKAIRKHRFRKVFCF
jgi:hypothetical protein